AGSAGSERGLMQELLGEKERPLYGQAVPMRLGRLADADIAGYIVDRFRQSNRSAGECVVPLVATAAGHPQRAMLLAYRLWDEIPAEGTGTLPNWDAALDKTLLELEPEFEARWQRY